MLFANKSQQADPLKSGQASNWLASAEADITDAIVLEPSRTRGAEADNLPEQSMNHGIFINRKPKAPATSTAAPAPGGLLARFGNKSPKVQPAEPAEPAAFREPLDLGDSSTPVATETQPSPNVWSRLVSKKTIPAVHSLPEVPVVGEAPSLAGSPVAEERSQPTSGSLPDPLAKTEPPVSTIVPPASSKWAKLVAKKTSAPAVGEPARPPSPRAALASATNKFSWPRKKARAAESEAAAAAVAQALTDAVDTRPIGPTQDVKKPIIVRKSKEKKKILELPIRVYIGFLPEVTERDARDYARGIAERNCEQISIVYFDAFALNNGFAYEIHEGGSRRALLPEIIKFFEAQGPFEKGGTDTSLFIRTATRTVQVDRTRDGLQAFLLPESSLEEGTDWLEGTVNMTPAIQTMTRVLVVGAALFIAGFLAMSLALISRIQPYDPPPVPVVLRVTDDYDVSPISRWTMLQGVSGTEYVKALRFANGKWALERGSATPDIAPTGTVPMPPVPPAPLPAAAGTGAIPDPVK